MNDACLLIGDIGGTNARFALADPHAPGFSMQKDFACADFATAGLAMRAYLDEISSPQPDVICIAAAGPVIGETVRFTNKNWAIDANEIHAEFAGAKVALLNDFEAIAYSLPLLGDGDSQPIGLPETLDFDEHRFTFGVVGPGTGLGYAALYKRDGTLVPVTGVGGHQGFAPESQVQTDVLAMLRQRYDRVSNEKIVSGSGIQNIYWALTKIHGKEETQLSAAEIFARAEDERDPRAKEAVQLFFEVLGQIAGDLAISLSTTDGVYIAGGIAKRYPQLLADSRFRSGFDNKGRHRPLMERIPTRLITHPEPGLLGASIHAIKLSRGG